MWWLLLNPEIDAGLLVGFLALAAALVLVGLSGVHSAVHGSQNTQGYWQWLTHGGPILDLLGLGLRAARFVVSHFAASQLRLLARWFSSLGTLTGAWFLVLPYAIESLVHAIERVYHRGDPRARAKAQAANRHAINAGRTATHAHTHARSVGHALDRYKGRTNAQVRHLIHETTIALPRDIARVKHRERWAEKQLWKLRDRVKGLEDGAIKTWEWLRDHPGTAAVGAFTAAVAVALDTLGLGGVRCPQFNNLFKKRGCGLWNDLDSLLSLALVTTLALDLPHLIEEAQAITPSVVSFIEDNATL